MIFTVLYPLQAKAQITLNKNTNMSFGVLEYDVSHNGSLQLATTGSVTVIGSGLVSDGGAQAGSVTITNPSTGVVEVKCDISAVLKSGSNTLNLTNTEVVVNTGVAYGSGNACQGNQGADPAAVVVNLASTPSPNILMGGLLTIPSSSLVSGTYSTTNSGGSPVTLTVIFQ